MYHTTCGSFGNQQRREIVRHVQSIHAYDFFNLLAGPELLWENRGRTVGK
jgi:hypothetical protein